MLKIAQYLMKESPDPKGFLYLAGKNEPAAKPFFLLKPKDPEVALSLALFATAEIAKSLGQRIEVIRKPDVIELHVQQTAQAQLMPLFQESLDPLHTQPPHSEN